MEDEEIEKLVEKFKGMKPTDRLSTFKEIAEAAGFCAHCGNDLAGRLHCYCAPEFDE